MVGVSGTCVAVEAVVMLAIAVALASISGRIDADADADVSAVVANGNTPSRLLVALDGVAVELANSVCLPDDVAITESGRSLAVACNENAGFTSAVVYSDTAGENAPDPVDVSAATNSVDDAVFCDTGATGLDEVSSLAVAKLREDSVDGSTIELAEPDAELANFFNVTVGVTAA